LIKIIELFSGIGTQIRAFKNVYDDVESIGISEIDKRAIKAYNILNRETENFGDITKIESLPTSDVWTYSFPCTDLSIAGKQRGFQGENSSLLYQVKRLLVNSNRPKILIMENVANLLSPKFYNDFADWVSFLASLGYANSWTKVRACDYGGLSIRNRVYMVSVLGDRGLIFPQNFTSKTIVKDILLPPQSELLVDSDTSLYHEIEPNYGNSIRIGNLQGKEGQGNRIYSIFGQAITLTSNGGGKAGSSGGLYTRETGIYKLSGIEMMRIMGWSLEDSIKLNSEMSYRAVGFLMGNSIDLTVLTRIVEQIKALGLL
jgi:DNA (cytosine-5)-methyltransferase 1